MLLLLSRLRHAISSLRHADAIDFSLCRFWCFLSFFLFSFFIFAMLLSPWCRAIYASKSDAADYFLSRILLARHAFATLMLPRARYAQRVDMLYYCHYFIYWYLLMTFSFSFWCRFSASLLSRLFSLLLSFFRFSDGDYWLFRYFQYAAADISILPPPFSSLRFSCHFRHWFSWYFLFAFYDWCRHTSTTLFRWLHAIMM